MISYLNGELAAVEKEKVIVEVSGIGYGVFMSSRSFDSLPPVGNKIKIHTYMNVREDAVQLFGFLTKEELDFFKLLITVNGIGPKGGLGILSKLSVDELRFSVLSGDVKAICKAPGIGKKTAEKLIIELKDKLDIEEVLNHAEGTASAQVSTVKDEAHTEAIQALVALGYGNAESLRAVKAVALENPTAEDILKEALKKMM